MSICGSSHGAVGEVQNCDVVGSEFELLLRNSVYFWANTLGKGMTATPAMG